jgi:hypothetical protein
MGYHASPDVSTYRGDALQFPRKWAPENVREKISEKKWAVVEQGRFEPGTFPDLVGDLPNGYDITSRNSINHDGTTSTSTPHHSITRN